MKRIKLLVVSVVLGVLMGCASISMPSTSLIDEMPVVRIGSTDKPSGEYILYIPANTKFPVSFVVAGNAFASSASLNSTASMKKDIYLYQYWASHDGRNWVSTEDMFNSEISIGAKYSGGKAEIKLDYAD